MRVPKSVPFLLIIAACSAGAGLLYSTLTGGSSNSAGMIYGLCIGLSISPVERGFVLGRLMARIRRWPTWLYIPACEAGSVALVLIGFVVGGTICWSTKLLDRPYLVCVIPDAQVLIYALIVAAALVFVTRVRDLLGHAVFANLLVGRYHRPVAEQRIFLFLDLVGSTAYARAHGDLRAQEYLGAIYAAIAEPVQRHAGAIEDYIGDMALITWPEARGLRNADCFRCVFAIQQLFARDAAEWQRKFGQVPGFRAALHGGSVVTAEIGIDRHKISYFGDVVNTTGRLETLSRQLGVAVLTSADLLARCPALPRHIRAQSLGSHALHGREQPLEVFGLEQVEVPSEERAGTPAWTGARPEVLARGGA